MNIPFDHLFLSPFHILFCPTLISYSVQQSIDDAHHWVFWIAGISAGNIVATIMTNSLYGIVSVKLMARSRTNLMSTYLSRSTSFFDMKSVGELLSRLLRFLYSLFAFFSIFPYRLPLFLIPSCDSLQFLLICSYLRYHFVRLVGCFLFCDDPNIFLVDGKKITTGVLMSASCNLWLRLFLRLFRS